MKTINVLVQYLTDDAQPPSYANIGDAGADVRAAESMVIHPGGVGIVSTGISVSIPAGYEIQIRPRSGLAAKNGISVLNTPGTIDSGYRGEIKVILVNHGSSPFTIRKGDRIAQMVANEVPRMIFSRVESFPEEIGGRGTGGFGSTGVA